MVKKDLCFFLGIGRLMHSLTPCRITPAIVVIPPAVLYGGVFAQDHTSRERLWCSQVLSCYGALMELKALDANFTEKNLHS